MTRGTLTRGECGGKHWGEAKVIEAEWSASARSRSSFPMIIQDFPPLFLRKEGKDKKDGRVKSYV